ETHPSFNEETMAQIVSEPNGFSAVDTLLDSLDLSGYKSIFSEHIVDLNVLLSMNDADLRELGLKAFGPRRKLSNAIRDLNAMRTASSPLVPAGIVSNGVTNGVANGAIGANGIYANSKASASSKLNQFMTTSVTDAVRLPLTPPQQGLAIPMMAGKDGTASQRRDSPAAAASQAVGRP
ncbi:Ankyrin repeat and SAM domain-containing protein 3, partial [Cladochytrium tenue]